MWEGISQSVENADRTKWQRKDEFTLLAWAGSSIFSCPWASVLQVLSLQTWARTYTTDFCFSGLQTWTGIHHQFSWAFTLQSLYLSKPILIINSFTCIKTLMDYFAIILLLWATLFNILIKSPDSKIMYGCTCVCLCVNMHTCIGMCKVCFKLPFPICSDP